MKDDADADDDDDDDDEWLAAGQVVWRRTGHASQTQWSIHLRAQRPMCGR